MYYVLAILAFGFLGFLLHMTLKHQKQINHLSASLYYTLGAIAQQKKVIEHLISSMDNILEVDDNGEEA